MSIYFRLSRGIWSGYQRILPHSIHPDSIFLFQPSHPHPQCVPPQKKPIQMQPTSHRSTSIFTFGSNNLLHLEAGEGALLSLLVPLLGPNARADGDGHLSHVLASLLVALGGLEAEEPLVVAVPAVIGLVLGGESSIAGRRADVLDNVQLGGVLGRQLRHGFGEEFVDLGHIYNILRALCLSTNGTNPAQYETNIVATALREKVGREVNTSVRYMYGISFNKHSQSKIRLSCSDIQSMYRRNRRDYRLLRVAFCDQMLPIPLEYIPQHNMHALKVRYPSHIQSSSSWRYLYSQLTPKRSGRRKRSMKVRFLVVNSGFYCRRKTQNRPPQRTKQNHDGAVTIASDTVAGKKAGRVVWYPCGMAFPRSRKCGACSLFQTPTEILMCRQIDDRCKQVAK